MQSEMWIVGNRKPTKDEYLDDDGNLVRVHAIDDEAHLVAPMVPPALASQTQPTIGEA